MPLGWSIAFFSGYAMYFVPDLQLVSSELLELVILLGLAAGAMYDAIRSRSEFTASLSTTFATVGICLATSTVNPYVALLIIVAAAAYVSVRQGWHSLLIYGTMAFYWAFSYVDNPFAYSLSADNPRFFITAFLLAGWLSVHLAVYFAQTVSAAPRKRLMAASLLNALFASYSLSNVLHRVATETADSAIVVPFSILGSIYLGTSLLLKRRSGEHLWTLHLLIGLSLLNIAMWAQFTGDIIAVLDLIQLGLLTIAGLQFRIKALRWFAVFLAVVTVPRAAFSGWMIGCLAVGIYGTAAYSYRHHSFREVLEPHESSSFSNVYFTLANIIAAVVIGSLNVVDMGWKGLLWTVQLLTNTTIALKTQDQYINGTTGLMLLINIPYLMVAASVENWAPTILATSMLYGFAGYCRSLRSEGSKPGAKDLKESYGLLATLVLTWFLWRSVPGSLLSIATGVEGMALIVAGFALREKSLRISGLVVFAIMAVHLLFFDLASAPTIARIISFIITGLMLVGCSYAYGWFSKKLNSPDKNSTEIP